MCGLSEPYVTTLEPFGIFVVAVENTLRYSVCWERSVVAVHDMSPFRHCIQQHFMCLMSSVLVVS
jgi:hypothetical protein